MSISTEEVIVATLAVQPSFGDDEMMTQGNKLEAAAKGVVITNDDEYRAAIAMGRTIQLAIKSREDFIKPMERAANDSVKQIRARKNMLLNPLKNAKKYLADAVTLYVNEQERKRREAEAAAKAAALAEVDTQLDKAIAAADSGDTAGENAAMSAAADAELAANNVAMAPGTPKVAGSVKRKVFEITDVDLSKVPTEFGGVVIRPVDLVAVKKLITGAEGQISIPGITFTKTEKVTFRV